MARMHPKQLTEAFTAFNTPSERMVYDKASRELSDEYHVFHDLRWDDPSLDEARTAGQMDFVIVHPDYGYVTLEVKGGRCSYDAETRLWESRDKAGQSHSISDPFDQASFASRSILKLLLKQPQFRNKYIPHHHAAVFPDCELGNRDLRANAHGWQILDQASFYDFDGSIKKLFTHAFPDSKTDIGRQILEGINKLHGIRSVKERISAGLRMREIEQKQILLTDRQLEVLNHFRDFRRLVIRGCAGSGKTMLAVHKAKLLAEQGKRVLLVCFNKALAAHLKLECQDCPSVIVSAFHDLCIDWLKETGKEASHPDPDTLFKQILPNAVADNIDDIPHRFDAIIADEGQDFTDTYWLLLEMLFDDPDDSIFYIFADCSQNIYGGTDRYPMITPPAYLERNIRNTNQVFQVVQQACDLQPEIKPSGIDGPKVEFGTYTDDTGMLASIKTILERLVSDGIAPADIVILGTKAQGKTVLEHGSKLGPFKLVERPESSNDLCTMTIHKFKGLESKVVILCELDDKMKHNVKELLYTGLTRSTCMLFVLGQKETYPSTLWKPYRAESHTPLLLQ